MIKLNHNITFLRHMMANDFLEWKATTSCKNEIISKRSLIGKEITLEEAKWLGEKREERPSSSVSVFIIQQVAFLTSLQQNIIVFPERKKVYWWFWPIAKFWIGTLKLILLWTQEMALTALSKKDRKQCVNQCSASISTSINNVME